MKDIRIASASTPLTTAEAELLLRLISETWPPAEGAPPYELPPFRAYWEEIDAVHFLIGDHELLAHSLIFRRKVTTTKGEIVVGALASVCVPVHARGQGLGAKITQAAFDYLPELGAEVSQFQTGVPKFYEKLGGRLISNPLVNGTNPKHPFWDPFAMIWPGTYDWPAGQIDLNGPGY